MGNNRTQWGDGGVGFTCQATARCVMTESTCKVPHKKRVLVLTKTPLFLFHFSSPALPGSDIKGVFLRYFEPPLLKEIVYNYIMNEYCANRVKCAKILQVPGSECLVQR
jgi:hypothetical protein